MYKPKIVTGWRARRPAADVTLSLNGRTATSRGRKLEGEELEAAKARLMARYAKAPGIRTEDETLPAAE